jgi:hypothetical protein
MDQHMHAHAERGDVPPLDEALSLPEADEKQHLVFDLPEPYADKVKLILEACHDRNLDALIELATSEGGLVNDEARQTACKTQLSSTCLFHSLSAILHAPHQTGRSMACCLGLRQRRMQACIGSQEHGVHNEQNHR